MKTLKLADNLTLPVDVVTQTLAIVAKRRVGKSYTMRKLVEQLHHAGQQVCLIDPKGDQWGIRSSADGRGPGLPIIILGGERGDVPLEVGAGEVVAKLVVEERVSTLLDLSGFRKREVAVFMAAFLEALYRLKAREVYRTPMMVVVDEADAIAPQKPQPGEERMLGAIEDIVRRGGQRGIGCALVTQRTAVLNKNVLTQAQILVALRTIAPQDLKAMKDWIDVHGDDEQRKTLMASLPSLPVGDAWFWSPGWPTGDGIFARVHVAPIETFDSGSTPRPGERRAEPRKAADVDLEALKRQMAATIEKAKADDPKELKRLLAQASKDAAVSAKRISELEARVSGTSSFSHSDEGKKTEVPVLTDADRALLADLAGLVRDLRAADLVAKPAKELGDVLTSMLASAVDTLLTQHAHQVSVIAAKLDKAGFTRILEKLDRVAAPQCREPRAGSRNLAQPSAISQRPETRTRRNTPENADRSPAGDTVRAGERRILTAIAQHVDGVTREQLTVLTGYKRSSRDTYLQRLGAAGLIDVQGGTITATPAGVQALGDDFEPLPTGRALQTYWLDRLPTGEAIILRHVLDAHPQAISRDLLSEATGYKRSSRDTYLQRLGARQLVVSDRDGVRAAAMLF